MFQLVSFMMLAVFCATVTSELSFDYHSFQDMRDFLRDVSHKYSNLTSLRSIGKSHRDEDLLVLQVSAAPPERLGVPNVKLIGNIHGNEPLGKELILHFIEFLVTSYPKNKTVQCLLNNTRIHFLPSANPDGFKRARFENCSHNARGRTNFRGVDLNRNFPDQFYGAKNLEPETISIMKWIKETPFILSASLHSSNVVAVYPFHNRLEDTVPTSGFDDDDDESSKTPDDDVFQHLALVYTWNHPTMHRGDPCSNNGRRFNNGTVNGAAWFASNGGMQDYNYVWHGCLEITLELSCCKYPSKDDLPMHWRQNKEAMFLFLSEAHRGVKGLILDCADNATIPGAKLLIVSRNFTFNSTRHGEYWRILLPGNYTIKVSARGYKQYSTTFSVQPQKPGEFLRMTWLNIYLTKLSSNQTCTKNADYQTTTTEISTTSTTTEKSTTTILNSRSFVTERFSRSMPRDINGVGNSLISCWSHVVLCINIFFILK